MEKASEVLSVLFLLPLLHNQDVTSALTAQLSRSTPLLGGLQDRRRGGRFLTSKLLPAGIQTPALPVTVFQALRKLPGDAAEGWAAFAATETAAGEQPSLFPR